MGTYTTHYQLFMPSIGEQGWGDLVNGNFSIIDTIMKGLSNRATALENADTAFNTRITKLESGEFEGTVSANEFSGKLIVSSLVQNSNNIKVCTLSMSPISGGISSTTISPSDVTITKYNTSILNCVYSDTEIQDMSTVTCSVSMYYGGISLLSGTVYVKTEDGTTVQSHGYYMGNSSSTSFKFELNFNETYVITGLNSSISTSINIPSMTWYVA